MKKVVFRFAIVTVVTLFFTQSRWANADDTSTKGASTFQANCEVCHGADGRGSAVGKSLQAPDLQSGKVQAKTDAALARFISEGNGAMPAFKDRLSHQEILDEVQYIRHLSKKDAATNK